MAGGKVNSEIVFQAECFHISNMALTATFFKRTFQFNFRARTSRGSMTQKDSWFIKVFENNHFDSFGIGEAGPLPGLSKEWHDDFESEVAAFVRAFNEQKHDFGQFSTNVQANVHILLGAHPRLIEFPSILYAFETAILDLCRGAKRLIVDNDFVKGKAIPINGLIWMGGMDQMLQQIEIKTQEGFNCLKLKVGGIDFERECDILQYVRRKYFKMDIMIRLDANGAFKPEDVMYKLHELSKYGIQSIEQPIKAGNKLMAEVCKNSPIPVALDEELIGVTSVDAKRELLSHINPQFIILKPSLHGGIAGCLEWIRLAEDQKIGWWFTSALESNVGLNAVAQLASASGNPLHQGLGTGKIYENNFESPLSVQNGYLHHKNELNWAITE